MLVVRHSQFALSLMVTRLRTNTLSWEPHLQRGLQTLSECDLLKQKGFVAITRGFGILFIEALQNEKLNSVSVLFSPFLKF